MANQNEKPSALQQRRGLDLVEEWLHMESVARPRRRSGLHPNNAYSKSQSIYKNQIPMRMDEFRAEIDSFLDDSLDRQTSLRLGRLMLESASLAQHGFLLGSIARGSNIMRAMDESWHLIQGFKEQMRSGRVTLPDPEKLKAPIQNAISEYTRQPYGHHVHTYIGMVAFSVTTAVHLRDADAGKFILPSPGLNPEILDQWDYDPQLVPKSRFVE